MVCEMRSRIGKQGVLHIAASMHCSSSCAGTFTQGLTGYAFRSPEGVDFRSRMSSSFSVIRGSVHWSSCPGAMLAGIRSRSGFMTSLAGMTMMLQLPKPLPSPSQWSRTRSPAMAKRHITQVNVVRNLVTVDHFPLIEPIGSDQAAAMLDCPATGARLAAPIFLPGAPVYS